MTPLVRRVVARNPGPYTLHGTCSYIVGEGEVAAVDPGPDDPEHTQALLGALGPGERVSHILVTHSHTDHSPGARRLRERTGAPVYGFGPPVRIDDPDGSRVIFGDPDADPDPAQPPPPRGGDLDFRPDVRLRHGELIKGSQWTIEAVHTPGHASNHLCYRILEDRALCTGDHVMGWATTVISPPDGNLTEYLESMDGLIEGDRDDLYLPGHGPPIDEPCHFVRALVAHRHDRDAQIIGLLEQGLATIAEMTPVMYSSLAKRIWPAAASSVYAHLLRLESLGVVRAVDGGSLSRAGRIKLSA
ncbi:MAG: MBL fold metallo-hydrolase [Actinomycetota bacterium]|nr:MBL fold metallo-hydrolase [Actinomycetota bacterium]